MRILRTPQFVNKNNRVLPSALRPQRGHDRVSVVRWAYRERPGEAFKQRCLDIGNSGTNAYCGVGVLHTQTCLDAGTTLEDDRAAYDGHANIVFPFAVAKDAEPNEGSDFSRQVEIANAILQRTAYVADPAPLDASWTIRSALLPTD